MRHLLLLIVSLIAVAITVDAWCGTTNPRSHGRAACIRNPCDTEEGRAPYYFTQGSSPIYSFTINSILFGNYYNDADLNKRYNDTIDALKTKYLSMLGMDLTIRSTFVTDEYQQVGSEDFNLHQEMANKYYRQGEMTLMFSFFTDTALLGYGYYPWQPQPHGMVTTAPTALGAGKTTIFHEVGHMLGLLHVFNEDNDCGDCIERPSSPDRNVVGDFCNDTLPMGNERFCGNVTFNCLEWLFSRLFLMNLILAQNCKGESFASLDQLPINNYMAYTPDDCQTLGFTPQQIARARCYLATQLTYLTSSTTPGMATGTPSNSNAPGKTSAATSVVVSGAVWLWSLVLWLSL